MMKIERQFAEVRASGDDRKVKFIFSTDTKDRHGTRINPDGWRLDNFNKNGVASFQHRAYGDPDPDMIIGKANAWKSDGRLVGTIDFETEDVNPLADKLYKKVNAGTLNAVSVGFVEHDGHWGGDEDRGVEGEDKDTYYFDDVELMEISLVSVPSNPEALAYRGFEVQGDDKLKITLNGEVLAESMSTTIIEKTQTDLTKQVTKSNKMEDNVKNDLPQDSKVEVNTEKLDAAVDKLADVVEKMTPKEPLPGPPAQDISEKDKKELDKYSIHGAILKKAEAIQGMGKFDGIELEMHQEAVKEARDAGRAISGIGIPAFMLHSRADLQATTDGVGGYTVGTDTTGFIPTLQNTMATMRAGATMLSGLVGDVSIPRLATDSTATWRSEGGVATESDPTFEAVTMTPHRLTSYTVYSMQLLRQGTPDVTKIVNDTLYYSIANALETAAFEGDGTSNVPVGILNGTNVGDATHGSSNPTVASWANIVNMEKHVAVDNALAARMAYVMKATAAAKLKTTARDSVAGGYIWESSLVGGEVNGYPAYVTNVFTDDTVIFGDFSALMYGQWGGLDLLVNPYSLDTYAQIRVVIAGYFDMALRHGQSFSRINDLGV